ncbi:MAG: hypothetical protein IPM16_04395 [Chloroflexi bacterium]|nr:hypothetical protein [Chloroflexota bacterium]
MRFDTSLQRLFIALALAFAAVLLATSYWAIAGPETVLQGSYNYRLRDEAARIVRGTVFDRDGDILTASIIDEDGRVTRTVITPDLYALVGYSSLQYGTSGVENAFDALLTGTDLYGAFEAEVHYNLLHYPRIGSDIQLSVDDTVQRAAWQALADDPGGAIVLDPRTGGLLAMVSQPSVAPVTLDLEWAQLIRSPENPFVNRAVQGAYPSSIAERVAALAAWMVDGRLRDETVERAALGCGRADTPLITVADAFVEACPGFVDWIAEQVGAARMSEVRELFGLDTRTSLPGFDAAPIPTTAQPDATDSDAAPLRSPLELAVMIATLENDGNAPVPSLLLGTRAPGETEFVAVLPAEASRAVVTSTIARGLASVLRRTGTAALDRVDPPCTLQDPALYISSDTQGDSLVRSVVASFTTGDGQTRALALVIEQAPEAEDDLVARAAALMCAVQDAADGD